MMILSLLALRRSKDRSHCKSTRDSAHGRMKVGAHVNLNNDLIAVMYIQTWL